MEATDQRVLTRGFTVPNLITGMRIALIPIFAWVFLSGRSDLAAFALLAVVGGSDWVDGFAARRLGQVSVLGKLLDPVADRVAVITVLAVLAFRGTVWWPLAATVLLRDALVSVAFFILEARGYPRISVNTTGKVATFAIFSGMGLAAASVAFGDIEAQLRPMSEIFLAVGAVLYWAAAGLYVKDLRKGPSS